MMVWAFKVLNPIASHISPLSNTSQTVPPTVECIFKYMRKWKSLSSKSSQNQKSKSSNSMLLFYIIQKNVDEIHGGLFLKHLHMLVSTTLIKHMVLT